MLPVIGICVFIALYFLSTVLYPGGSPIDKNAVGFSWANNYWCNLLNEHALNGQRNPAKPIAMTGMFVLCFSLSLFWLIFPQYTLSGKKLKLTIQICGITAMAIALLLLTTINHDSITNLASAFGIIATIGTLVGLYKIKWSRLFLFGLLNILLVVLNNYAYHTKGLILYLPLIQKISFASFLIWVSCIEYTCITQLQKINKAPQSHC